MKIKEYMNVKEAAEYLGISAITLKRWEKQNKIEVYRNPINNYRMYKKEDLEKILNDIKK